MSKKKDPVVVDGKAEETTNLPVNIEDEIRKQLAGQKKHLGAMPANKIGLKGKEFHLPDGQTSKGPLEMIILDYVWFMVHYKGAYNANNPQKPDCFACGREAPNSGELKADEQVLKPYGETCHEDVCPKNAWKSAPTGNGKACKNQRRLIVVPPDFDADTDIMTMYVSPQGLKNFDAYVSRLQTEHGILPVQCVTEVSFNPDLAYPLLQFRYLDRHPRVAEAWSKREEGRDLLFRGIELDESAQAA